MRVTLRDRRVLTKLAAARWLTTRQIAALCFSGVSLEMARRRLRLLGESKYAFSHQENQMAEALHSVGPHGKMFLMERGWKRPISLARRPPKNLEHFLGINDIRVTVERSAQDKEIVLGFFFASWELQEQGWAAPVIPDAACHVTHSDESMTLLFEYDRGEESVGYVQRTKFGPYAAGLRGVPFSRVIVVVDHEKRREELRKHAERTGKSELFLFTLHKDMKGGPAPAEWFA